MARRASGFYDTLTDHAIEMYDDDDYTNVSCRDLTIRYFGARPNRDMVEMVRKALPHVQAALAAYGYRVMPVTRYCCENSAPDTLDDAVKCVCNGNGKRVYGLHRVKDGESDLIWQRWISIKNAQAKGKRDKVDGEAVQVLGHAKGMALLYGGSIERKQIEAEVAS